LQALEQAQAGLTTAQAAASQANQAAFRALVAALPQCVASGSATTGTTTAGGASSGASGSGASTGTSGASSAALAAAASSAASSTRSTGSGGGMGGGSSASLPATQLQDAENAVATAQTALTNAQDNLAAATMVAPIDGVVASLPFAAGDAVSTSSAVTIIGSGPVTVSLTVPATNIQLLKVGQSATLTQLGQPALPASVTTVGLLPSSSGFTVVVTCTDPGADALLSGVSATVAITVLTSNNAVLVPVSAVVRAASSSTSADVVVVNSDGSTTDTTVTLGAVGDTMAAVTQGLTAGQQVELADSTAALPTTSTLSLGRSVRTLG